MIAHIALIKHKAITVEASVAKTLQRLTEVKMSKLIIGTLSLAVVAGIACGGVALGYKFAPEVFNDFYKLDVATVNHAYIDKNDALDLEQKVFNQYNGEFIPLYYDEKSDIERLDLLDPLVFKSITKKDVASELVKQMDIYPPKPFIIETNGTLKNICFIHSTDFRNNSGGAELYAASKCRIGFEEFKQKFSEIMPESQVLDDTSAYIEYYNQKATSEQLADDTIYRYYFNLIAGIDASLQAMRKDNGLSSIKSYMESKKNYVSDPYFLFYDYDSPFLNMVIQEAQAGNLPLEATPYDALKMIYSRVQALLPNDQLIALMVNQYEIETRANTARKGIVEGEVFKELIEM